MSDPAVGYFAERIEQAKDTILSLINGKRAFHYQALFCDESGELTPHGEKVLADLDKFCRGNASTYQADARSHALLEGRREVLLRILAFLDLDSRDVRHFVEVKDEISE